MSKSRLLILCGFAALLWLDGCATAPAVKGLDGRAIDPLAQNTGPATVLIFVSNDCPISNRYVPEINRLAQAYGPRGVAFWTVHCDPHETAQQIREHDRQYELIPTSLCDPGHALARLCHAEVTPTAAVFAPGRRLVYHGRIDDRVTDLQKERYDPVRRDLAEALDAVLAGRDPTVAETTAIGCFIPSPP